MLHVGSGGLSSRCVGIPLTIAAEDNKKPANIAGLMTVLTRLTRAPNEIQIAVRRTVLRRPFARLFCAPPIAAVATWRSFRAPRRTWWASSGPRAPLPIVLAGQRRFGHGLLLRACVRRQNGCRFH